MGFKKILREYKEICNDNYDFLKSRLIGIFGGMLVLTGLGLLFDESDLSSSLKKRFYSKKTLERQINDIKQDRIVYDNDYNNEFILIQKYSKVDHYPPITFKTDNFYKDSEDVLFARLFLGEARGCHEKEKIAIAHTVINRLRKWNTEKTIKEVILKPWQYSCFNKDNIKSIVRLKDPQRYAQKEFSENVKLAKKILTKKYNDPTNGATHYFSPKSMNPPGEYPEWAKTLKKVGRIKVKHNQYSEHIFYK